MQVKVMSLKVENNVLSQIKESDLIHMIWQISTKMKKTWHLH